MNMNQKVLTKIFESLLNTAAQAPTDDIVNRDGISLMKQGFELIMQAHREGGASGPTSPRLAEARQLLADVEAKERINNFLGVGMPQKPVTLTTLSEQLARIEEKLAPIHDVVVNPIIKLDFSQEDRERLNDFLLAEARDRHSRHLHL